MLAQEEAVRMEMAEKMRGHQAKLRTNQTTIIREKKRKNQNQNQNKAKQSKANKLTILSGKLKGGD